MIPEKNKTYTIACLNPSKYNKHYTGIGYFTGDFDHCMEEDNPCRDKDDYVTYYEFNIPSQKEPAWFNETEIIAETKFWIV